MIEVFRPSIGQEEIDAVGDVLRSGWIGLGPVTAEFEREFARYVGVPHAIATNSCTAALDLAVKLLGINHGDEVIVPTMTFVSTAHVVAYNLGTPIFADCDERALTFDIEDVAAKITRRTKAIIAVHFGGRPEDMDRLRAAVGSIPIIEDAAHACGGRYRDASCGSLGEIGCFSFHAVKNLTMGDGGAITMREDAWARRAKQLRWLGIDKGTWERTTTDRSYWWQYQVEEIGLKCHLNDILAAIGRVQLGKLEGLNRRRREIVARYFIGLGDVPQIELPLPDDDVFRSAWHILHVKCERRDDLSAHLRDRGINSGVHYTPIHTYRCYGNRPSLPVAERIQHRILTLPLYPDLADADVDRVIEAIREFYRK